jgi:2-phospho-L-lactate guanylyltransferase
MSLWTVLPLKDFVNAKKRLSGLLNPTERSGLFQAMVEDVLAVLQRLEMIDGVLIVSDDPGAELLAQQYGAEIIAEGKAGGLNPAISKAVDWLVERNIDTAMILHGDIPLIQEADIESLIISHRQQSFPAVTLATDSHQQGSNCMLCSPPNVIPFHYGLQSFQKHRAAAAEVGANWNGQYVANLACDIDEPADLNNLPGLLAGDDSYQSRKTFKYLSDSGILAKIEQINPDL